MIQLQSLRRSLSFMHGNILVFSITGLLGQFSRAMVFPYASLYILALGGNPEQIGFVNALAPFLGLVVFPIAGYLADHANRSKVITWASYYSAGVVLLFVLAPRWELIAVAMLFRGAFSLQFPPRSAMIADSLSPEERGRGIAVMNTIYGMLAIVSPYLAGIIVDPYGPNWGIRILYGFMMLLYLASAIIHHRFLVETTANTKQPIHLRELPGVLRDAYRGTPALLRSLPASLQALSAVIVLMLVTNGVVGPFWVVYVVQEIGLSPATWGFILLVETVARLLLFIPGGLLVDRWGRSASLFAALTLALITLPLFVFVQGFIPVLLIRLSISVVQAIVIPACTALMADMVPRDSRGRVMAALGQGGVMLGSAGGGTGGPSMGFIVTIPLMVASLLGGYLYGWNPIAPWLFAFGAMVFSILLILLFIRDPKTAEV